jgi:hypothetical protein
MCGIEIAMAERPEPDGTLATVMAERDAWVQRAFEAERFATQTAIERQHLADAIDGIRLHARETARRDAASESEAAFAAIRDERDRARGERDAMTAERDRAIAERDQARIEARDTGAMLDRVTSSTAWRLTGPARRVLQAVLRR